MPVFAYKAVSPDGETIQGEMEASSADDVVLRLQDAGNVPIDAREAGSGAGGLRLSSLGLRRGQVSQREIGEITQQLATLLGAGLPLDRALQVLIDLAENERVQRLIHDIREQVRGGSALSGALEAQHGVFSRFYVNMIRAGEVGGTLDEALARMGEYLERQKELKSTVVSSLIYPALLMFMAGGSLVLLLTWVMPKFQPIFDQLGGDLPAITEVVLAFAHVLRDYWWLLLGLAVLGFFYMRRQLAHSSSRLKWDDWFLRVRGIGDLIAKVEMARLSRTLGTLLQSGVPVLSALTIARNVLSNTVLMQAIDEAAEEVKTGGSLAHTMAGAERFPKLALQMINVGEETGQLDVMLLRVAEAYDREVRTTIDRLLGLLVPVLTLVMAVLIGTIIIAILLAIFSVNEMIG